VFDGFSHLEDIKCNLLLYSRDTLNGWRTYTLLVVVLCCVV